MPKEPRPHVVIVGGGFGGLYAAMDLGNRPVRVTLIDKRNFHLFQPLLYQVATGSLSPADISSPLRTVLARYDNIRVIMDELVDFDPQTRRISLRYEPEPLAYDYLVVATGSQTHYFGHTQWSRQAPGLKTVEDALEIRREVFSAFELAEREPDPQKRRMLMTFVLIGGGPTGVEMAGALAELANHTLNHEFRSINPKDARILLLDASPRVLSTYPEDLSQKAAQTLHRLGVTVRTGTKVTHIEKHRVVFSQNGQEETIEAATILWSAGVTASPVNQVIAERTGCTLARGGRVPANPDFSVGSFDNLFVIGDLAYYDHTGDRQPLPGVASVAIQSGRHIARLVLARIHQQSAPVFQYQDKGSLAVIGINEAVAALGRFHLSGFLAWIIWAFVHVRYLIGFDNKLLVMIQWSWSFFTRKHSARLITSQTAYE